MGGIPLYPIGANYFTHKPIIKKILFGDSDREFNIVDFKVRFRYLELLDTICDNC